MTATELARRLGGIERARVLQTFAKTLAASVAMAVPQMPMK